MNNENLSRIKSAWKEMGDVLELSDRNLHTTDLDEMKTSLDRLCSRYNRLWLMSLCMIFPTFMTVSRIQFIESAYSVALSIIYPLYFLACFILNYWLWQGVKSINPVRMSVSDVSSAALYYRKRHFSFIRIMLPIAMIIVGFTIFCFSDGIYEVYAIIGGAIVGLIIGTLIFFRFLNDYKNFKE